MKELESLEKVPLETLRERVLDDLAQRYSLEGLGMEDFEARTSLAAKALTKAELLDALEGLPEGAPSRSVAAASTSRRDSAYPSTWRYNEDPAPRQSAIAVFGGFERRGLWRAPRRMESLCVFGGGELDLTEALIPREGLTISALAVFGGLNIVVPPDIRLEVAGAGIFGGFDHKNTEAGDSAPLVRIEGLAIFGGVGIKIGD